MISFSREVENFHLLVKLTPQLTIYVSVCQLICCIKNIPNKEPIYFPWDYSISLKRIGLYKQRNKYEIISTIFPWHWIITEVKAHNVTSIFLRTARPDKEQFQEPFSD